MKVNSYNKKLFNLLTSDLNKHGVKYAIIGDYKNLPESVGHDIDIWTDNVSGFRRILFASMRSTGFRLLIDNQSANGSNVAIYKRIGDEITLMKIDILVDTSYKSTFTLVNSKTIANNVIPYNGFYIVNAECEAIMHFLYPIFEWGKIKKDCYKSEIKTVVDSPVFKGALVECLGKSFSQHIISLIRDDKWAQVEQEIREYKKKLIMSSLFSLTTIKKICSTISHTLSRKFHPAGKCLAFCGLDGAGKTTILNELNDMFVDLLKQKKVYYGYWRPFVIPEIRELFGKKNSKADVDQKEQVGKTIIEADKKAKNKVISMVKFFYYWLDYVLASRKYGAIQERGGMVLFDRHYIDMAVHPGRFDMNISSSLIMFMYKFIPKADYTFFLYCTPEEIHARKEEFTKEEIQEHTNQYMNKGKKIKNFIPIHTNTTITDEIDKILTRIALD